jgi:hypothetical protein
VRLLTRNGKDWSGRFPWIAESALKNRHSQFVIDGEALILGVDGIADFNGLHSRQHDEEVQLYAFDIVASWRSTVRICAACRYPCERPTTRAPAGWHLRGAFRARRDWPGPLPRRL